MNTIHIHTCSLLFSTATGIWGVDGKLYAVSLNSAGRICVWGYNADVGFFFVGPNLVDGQWHTVSVTYNGAGLLSLYIDGAFIQSQTVFYGGMGPIVYYTTGDSNWLGTLDGANYNFIGYLQNIAFYNYALTAVEASPFYSLSGPYSFDGASSNFVQLTNLVCVKGNNARSIKFQMLTSTAPIGFGVMIGILMSWLIISIY